MPSVGATARYAAAAGRLESIDEFTRECLAIVVARCLESPDVLEILTRLFVERAVPQYLRSDNGPEFRATDVREWLQRGGAAALY